LALLVVASLLCSSHVEARQVGAGAADETQPGTPWDLATPAQTMKANMAYKRGVLALRLNKPVEALERFRESYAIVASPNSRLMVVQALAELGRDVAAYHEAVALVAEAEAAAAKAARRYEATLKAARAELEAAEARVALVKVSVAAPADDVAITVGGAPLAREVWGTPQPYAPGSLEIVITSAAGSRSRTLEATAGESFEVELTAPRARPEREAPKPDTPVAEPEDPGVSPLVILGGVSLAIGAIGFAGFAGFGTLSNDRIDELESACPDPQRCDQAFEPLADEGRTYQTVANVGLGLGITGVAAGAILLIVGLTATPSDGEEGATLLVSPGGVTLRQSF
jgi:hypothetical protein